MAGPRSEFRDAATSCVRDHYSRHMQAPGRPATRQLAGRRVLDETVRLLVQVRQDALAEYVEDLRQLAGRGGQLHVLGNGGCAAIAQHAVTDFAMPAVFDAARLRVRTPLDNVGRLTMLVNDHSWAEALAIDLEQHAAPGDEVLLLSSGGAVVKSANLLAAARESRRLGARPRMLLGSRDTPLGALAPPVIETGTAAVSPEVYESVALTILHATRALVQEISAP